ncbi:MAG: cytochrome P450 [Sphingomonadales bacterium]|jgi:cytochrome P450|nr:cytochrome P450 [Sphingomonadales bacterium]MBK6720519.1 cytochrome P450 [Sphingomonadales bacterium]MBK8861100.1 cytochrome P450 [Sphingomonadales bacterium]
MSLAIDVDRSIPAHVSDDMIKDWPFQFGTKHKGNPYVDLVDPVHASYPDIFFTRDSYPGAQPAWVVRRFDDVSAIYKDNVNFINMGFAPFAMLTEEDWHLVPAEMDPPKHGRYRAMIFPLFTPKAVRALEAKVSDYASQYINQFKDKGGCEFMSEFAFEFPIKVVLDLIGLPQDMVGQFLEWETDLLHGHDLETIAAATKNVVAYLRAEIDERKRKPREDLLTFGVNAEVDGVKMTDDEVLGFAFNLFIGGLDTVSTNLGLQFWHLATHHEDQTKLRANPALIPDAIEEMLRAYAAVSTFRTVAKKVEVNGVTMMPGDKVIMSTTLAGRDPAVWANPETIDFGRKPQHVSFATGPHLCLGLHLARRELTFAMSQFLKDVPQFRLAPGTETEFHLGMIQPLALPLVW